MNPHHTRKLFVVTLLLLSFGNVMVATPIRFTNRVPQRRPRPTGTRTSRTQIEPVLAAARVAGPTLAELIVADDRARNAEAAYDDYIDQLALRLSRHLPKKPTEKQIEIALRPYNSSLVSVVRRFANAENALRRKSNAAWRSIRYSLRVPTLVNQPLEMALFDLHVAIRRRVGPRAHTRLSGLKTDTGCRGDLVANKLVQKYAHAITAVNPDTHAQAGSLGRIAMQVACMSSRQLTNLEIALSEGHEYVSERLKRLGRQDMIPAFTWYVAPLQAIVFDARKHRGNRSQAWHWFVKNGQTLIDHSQRYGWPGDALWLWDRLAGQMVGFPVCTNPSQPGNCVDPVIFIKSLEDPRALGRGDCALAAMVSHGPTAVTTTTTADQSLYTCPSFACNSTASPGIGPTTTQPTVLADISVTSRFGGRAPTLAEENNVPWPDLTADDLNVMRGFCVGPNGGSRLQGDDVGDCLFNNQQKNPFDNYLKCTAEGLSGEPPQIGEFAGVPMSPQCRLAEEASSSPTPEAQPGPSNEPSPEAEKEKEEHDKVAGIVSIIATAAVRAVTHAEHLITTAAGEVLGTLAELLSPEGAEAERGAGQFAVEMALRKAEQEGRITTDEWNEMRGKKFNEVSEFLKDKKGQSCADEFDCSDACSGMSQAVATSRACTSKLLDDLTTALGRGSRTQPTKHPDWVSNWHPDQAPVPETDFCLPGGGDTGPNRTSANCALVLCAGAASDVNPRGQCCATSAGGIVSGLMSSRCLAMYCPNSTPVVDAQGRCGCAPTEGQPDRPPRGPRPDPTRSPIP